MTFENFQKKVVRANWYDKYFYSLLFLAATLGGLFFLYDVIVHHEKYDKSGTCYLGYLSFLILTAIGISGFFFIPNRYKIITISSALSSNQKQKIIGDVLKEFGEPLHDANNDFYDVTYSKNWWSSGYKIYLTYDDTNFYTSVQGVSTAPGGFIDFGGTEKVRRQLTSSLTKFADRQ